MYYTSTEGKVIEVIPLHECENIPKNIPDTHTWKASFWIYNKKRGRVIEAYETGSTHHIAKKRLMNLLGFI